MSTRTKLFISSYTASAMMLLVVFSKPLHIPEPIQWVLLVGVFLPIGLSFYYIKKQKQEKREVPVVGGAIAPPVAEPQRMKRRRLILMMAIACIMGLASPLWLPLTGTTLGTRGDFVVGLVTAAIICTIFGLILRKT